MTIRGKDTPCKGCTLETGRAAYPVNCHTYCKKYLDFIEENEITKNNKYMFKQKLDDYYYVRQKHKRKG